MKSQNNLEVHMSDNNSNHVPIFSILCLVLTIMFLVFKLAGVIDWAWILIFLPLIICVGLKVLIIVIVTIAIFLIPFIKSVFKDENIYNNFKDKFK